MYYFKTGKYAGKSLEEVALIDYPRIKWLKENGRIPQYWKKRIDEIIYALDNFESKLNCINCKNPARYISIVPPHPFAIFKDIAISTNYIFCSKECFESSPVFIHERAVLYPIKYSVLFSAFKNYTKRRDKKIADVLKEILTGKKRIRKSDLERLIDNIIKNAQNR